MWDMQLLLRQQIPGYGNEDEARGQHGTVHGEMQGLLHLEGLLSVHGMGYGAGEKLPPIGATCDRS